MRSCLPRLPGVTLTQWVLHQVADRDILEREVGGAASYLSLRPRACSTLSFSQLVVLMHRSTVPGVPCPKHCHARDVGQAGCMCHSSLLEFKPLSVECRMCTALREVSIAQAGFWPTSACACCHTTP